MRVVDVVPVESHAGFQAQGVAGAQAGGNDSHLLSPVSQAQEQLGSKVLIRLEIDFETVFPRVPGTGNNGRDILNGIFRKTIIGNGWKVRAGKAGKEFLCPRSLDGNLGILGTFISDFNVESACFFQHPGVVLVQVCRVDNQQIMVLRKHIHQKVIYKAPILSEKPGILNSAGFQFGRVV